MTDSLIAERIRERWDHLTKSDRRIARKLMVHYPVAGLETLAELAVRAGVSAPSVVRCIKKIGFDSYPTFQKALHREVQQGFEAISGQNAAPTDKDRHPYGRTEASYVDSIRKTLQRSQPAEIEQLAAAIAEAKASILCLGGRVSQALALVFQAHLLRLRRNVELVSTNPIERAERLMDVGKHDVVVVFDVAPYDPHARSFAHLAAEKKATIVCFTDLAQSPIAADAQFVVCASNKAGDNASSLTAAMCMTEIVLERIGVALGRRAAARRKNLVEAPQVTIGFDPQTKSA